jgi:hypothetical protein
MKDLLESVRRVAFETGFSGVVRVDKGSTTRFSEVYGWRRGVGLPNSLDSQFAIATGGKGITALAVVHKIVEGALSRDTTTRALIGDDPPPRRR